MIPLISNVFLSNSRTHTKSASPNIVFCKVSRNTIIQELQNLTKHNGLGCNSLCDLWNFTKHIGNQLKHLKCSKYLKYLIFGRLAG